MTLKKEPAACSTRHSEQTAEQNHLPIKSYLKAESLSSAKTEMGTLLLCLQFSIGRELSRDGWRLLERLLRRYEDGRLLFQGGSESSETTILNQRVSR